MWNVECDVDCEVVSVKVWIVKCGVSSVGYQVWSVKCGVWNVWCEVSKCKVLRVKW